MHMHVQLKKNASLSYQLNYSDNFNLSYRGNFTMKKILGVIALSAVAWLPLNASADTIDPAFYATSLAVGESVTIRKSVTIEESGPTGGIIDVMFLIDTSGSMGAEITAAKNAASAIIAGLGSFGDVATGVGYYSEPGSEGVLHDLTTNSATAIANIGTISLGLGGGGGDFPEEGIHATAEAAANASWRPGSTRFIIALGDATFKESDGSTLASAQSALADAGVTFIGIDYGRMDSFSGIQPLLLADATGGSIIKASGLDISDLVDDITAGVSASLEEYSTVTVDDLGAGMPGVDVFVTCVSADIGACDDESAVGSFDRSVSRVFEFDVTFTGLVEGVYEFDTLALVDGGTVAIEEDTITVRATSVPAPGALALFGLGLLSLLGIRRRNA